MIVTTEADFSPAAMDIEAASSNGLDTSDSPKVRCRPLSGKSTLEPVDEEPHSLSEIKQKTTVDRGVGPTPAPQTSATDKGLGLPLDGRKLVLPPFPVPNSPLEQSAYQQSLAYYYAVQQVASGVSPLGFLGSTPPGQPLSSTTNDGRYLFNPAFHHPNAARVLGSPTHSDLSILSNPALASSMDRLAAQMQWDRSQRQLHQMHSPYNLADTSSKRSVFSDIPATPGSGSVTLPPSLTSSRLTSPRPSVVGGRGRKRALSQSPLSEFLDIQSLTRSSEGSLQLTPLLHNPHSRSSSAASGSYGHLSAGSLASLTPTLKSASPFLHAAAAALYPGLQLPFHLQPFPPVAAPVHPQPTRLPPASIAQSMPSQLQSKPKQERLSPVQCGRRFSDISDGSAIVSSTVPHLDDHVRSEAKNIQPKLEADDEIQDFKETVCRWENCSENYRLHDDLVKHVNHDHISCNRKSFICRWKDCCRQEKPFKAQYMLVVHMRRHTGEKPHKCQGFPGCNKAYSRLENLKTHMRSHTGERPYLCEFPGCQKAFSNASDRAKHQNRTHSNEKPYACEIDGCSKRYTDPSSLRKHVKTVHGAEFYARKKHKGLDTPGCRTNKANSGADSALEGEKSRAVKDCLTVTGLGASDRNNKEQSRPSYDQDSSPQSDIDVEINVMKEFSTDVNLNSNVLNTLHEEISVVDDEESSEVPLQAGEPNGESLIVRRTIQANPNRNLKSKLSGKSASLAYLPSLPNVLGVQRNKLKDQSFREHSRQALKGRKLPEINVESVNGNIVGPRRDSNTSTLSSYMSSLRSDASPAMFNSRFSSRRSSEASQNSARLSIINSPYEYDMTGNLPDQSMQELHSMTERMEKARLGSQPNLYVQSQSMNLQSPSTRRDRFGRGGDFGCRLGDREGWRTATPAHTPLPHEYPQYERRRASDPVRCVDPNFNELKKLQHRFYSLNAMKPLPGIQTVNNNKPLRAKHYYSQETFQSSQSSMATNGYDAPQDFEANLEMKMIEDNEDVIIPDDMKQFLIQQKQQAEHQQLGNTTPRVTNAVDEWVQQTTSINHINGYGDTQNFNQGAPPVNSAFGSRPPPPYMAGHNYQNHFAANPHTPCDTRNLNGYSNDSHCHPCYSGCSAPPGYQAPVVCPDTASHHQQNLIYHHANARCNQQCLMPPPPPQTNGVAPLPHQHGLLEVRTGGSGPALPTHYNAQHIRYQPEIHHQQITANQQPQISPPCEVTSSTDHQQAQVVPSSHQLPPPHPVHPTHPAHPHTVMPSVHYSHPTEVPLHDNILDNISSISAAELHSHASHNFSSVSQIRQPPVDNASNMVINNMSSVLSQFADENKYMQHQH